MSKPEPRIVSEVCSVCGLDWKRHGQRPTTETCVKLLLDEVRTLNAQLAVRPYTTSYLVYPRPYWPAWYSGIDYSGGVTYTNTSGSSISGNTFASMTPSAVSIEAPKVT